MSGKKNIVRFVIGSLDIGGTERHLTQVLPELMDETFKPVVITLTHRGVLAEKLLAQGVQVIAPDKITRSIQRIPLLSRILGPFVTILFLVRTYKTIPANLTCFYLPSSYYLGMMAIILTGETGNTVMFRRSLNDYQNKRPFISRIEFWLHKKQMAIVGNSQAVINQLVDEEGVPEDKLTLIYNGTVVSSLINTDERSTIRHKLNIASDVIVLCIVANLIPYKGHSDLINALGLIEDKIKQPWLLLCVGAGVEARRDLIKLVDANKLSGNVRWLGQRRDVAEILSASDIGLLVSHHEGFSNSLLEGMAAGLPMIVTDVGGNPEAIINGESGLVVPSGQPQVLAQAILTLVNNSDIASRYGQAAKARVKDKFSMEASVENYKRLFKRIMSE